VYQYNPTNFDLYYNRQRHGVYTVLATVTKPTTFLGKIKMPGTNRALPIITPTGKFTVSQAHVIFTRRTVKQK